MGKILVQGKAERQYEADICFINFEITTDHSDSSAATKEADEIMEELLHALEQINIPPECFTITENRTWRTSNYDNKNKEGYISTRRLKLRTASNMVLVNDIREVIGNGFPKVAVSVGYLLSNERKLRKELFQEAIRDSRERAEMMAAAVGCKVTGLDTARLSDGDFDIDDIEDLADSESDHVYRHQMLARDTGRYADRLSTEKKELSAEVNIVWLTE